MIMHKLSTEDVPARFDVCGIGNAIVDLLTNSEDSFLQDQDIVKDSMMLVDELHAETLYGKMTGPVKASGGSVANSVAAIASLGGCPCYVGKVKNDDLGDAFIKDMEALGVHTPILPVDNGPSTARCMIFVTPDAKRSMCTYLGACVNLTTDNIDSDQIVNTKVTFLEGYLFDPPKAKEAFRYSAEIAHKADRLVALSLSDLFCVDRHREDFSSFISESVDILIGNEDELKSLYQVDSIDEAMGIANKQVEIVAGTCGERGVVIACGTEALSVPAEPIGSLVDTTGAGDMFAGGFLYGLTHGHSLEESGRIGTISAAEVLAHFGPRPKERLQDVMAAKGIKL